ncbi:hypothetical protein DMJ13_26055 [halophilic archaeon]|nr:hypothetical protein DMJ13_26055 [halophilic archaeon]
MFVSECECYLLRVVALLVSSERGGEFLDSDGSILAVEIPKCLSTFTLTEGTEEVIQIGLCRLHNF